MPVELDVQYAANDADEEPPSVAELQNWADIALRDATAAQVTIRIVNEDESRELNHQYRGKDKSTNVLSFPMDLPEELNLPMQGDLVICAAVVAREAHEQHKPLKHHWAHMVIHGMLHLQGYDHENDADAEEMESLEKQLLQQLGISNPYGNEHE